jgi:hypothetical protein
MSLTMNAATARLAREMGASEAAIADALVAATSLMHSAALVSSEIPNAPVTKTQSTLAHLTKMVAGLVEARGEAMRVHGQLRDIGREMGATEVWYCPDATLDSEQREAA